MSLTKPQQEVPLSYVVFDFETMPGWYWYDDKTTTLPMAYAWTRKIGGAEWSTVQSVIINPRKNGLFSVLPGYLSQFERDVLKDTDVLVTHNGNRFDLPMYQGWLLRAGMDKVDFIGKSEDTVQLKTGGTSKGLANIVKYFHLEDDKLHLGIDEWERIVDAVRSTGSTSHLDILESRVETDVALTRDLYEVQLAKGWR